jgi:predicted permease
LNIVGRLKRGVSVEQAQQKVSLMLRRYVDESEPASEQNRRVRESERVEPLPAAAGFGRTRQQFQMALRALMAITAAVLLITCLNLANLLLARASAREHEFAVRSALGAGSWRLVRQLLTESVLLALCGAALGAILAYPGAALLVNLLSSGAEIGLRLEAGTDVNVFLFHLITAMVCGVLFGLAPAFGARRRSLIPELKALSDGGSRLTGRNLLVSAQVALSVVVLVGAGLFLRTVYALRTTDIGFRPDHLLAIALSPKNAGLSDAEILPFFRAVRDRVSALPGVAGATYSQVRALSGASWLAPIVVEGFTPTGPAGNPTQASRNVVGPDYFRTFGIPLMAGRDFTVSDNATALKVAIVNESFARFYFPDQTALGKQIGVERPEYTIVGVARDAKYSHVREATPRLWYIPYEQYPFTKYLDLYVRTTGGPESMTNAQIEQLAAERGDVRMTVAPESMTNALRAAIASVDKGVALFDVRSQEAQIEELIRTERTLATLATFFGVIAAALAGLGLYGVLAFLVAQRRREIGVRMALGAEPREILKMILVRGMKLTLSGALIGLLAALALMRWIASLLFGAGATDLPTFAVVALLLTCMALLACYIPARRAAKVDPMVALRDE